MSIALYLRETRTPLEGPVYRVQEDVTAATGIVSTIFVFDVEMDIFSHVATPWDLENLLSDRDDSRIAGNNYYLKSSVTRNFNNQTPALQFASYTRERVSQLIKAYTEATVDFPGTQDYTFEG